MLPMAYDITNKVIFIMGAGLGIGKGIASGIFPDPVTVGEAGARRTAEHAAQMVPLG